MIPGAEALFMYCSSAAKSPDTRLPVNALRETYYSLYPLGFLLCQFHASLHMSSILYSAVQPRISLAFAGSE